MWAEDLVNKAHESLLESPDTLEKLWARGASNDQIQSFSLGVLTEGLPCECDPAFVAWFKRGAPLEEAWVFPLTNTLGKVRGFQFRSTCPERKGYRTYLISKEEVALFGLAQTMSFIWASRQVFLVEGVFDVFPVQRVLPWVLPTLTANVGVDLFRLLKRFVEAVWIGYDADSSGRRGAKHVATMFRNVGISTHVVNFPALPSAGVKDPSELWGAWGSPRFEQFLKECCDGYF